VVLFHFTAVMESMRSHTEIVYSEDTRNRTAVYLAACNLHLVESYKFFATTCALDRIEIHGWDVVIHLSYLFAHM